MLHVYVLQLGCISIILKCYINFIQMQKFIAAFTL